MNSQTLYTIALDVRLAPHGQDTDVTWLEETLRKGFGCLVAMHNGPADRWIKMRGRMDGLSVHVQPIWHEHRAHVVVELGVDYALAEFADPEDRDEADMHAECSLDALIVNLKHDLSPMRVLAHEATRVERQGVAA